MTDYVTVPRETIELARVLMDEASTILAELDHPAAEWRGPIVDELKGASLMLAAAPAVAAEPVNRQLLEALRKMVDLAEFWINREDRREYSDEKFKTWLALGHHSNAMREARAAIAAAETKPARGRAIAWVVKGPGGGVYHIAEREGWTVDEVVFEPPRAEAQPAEQAIAAQQPAAWKVVTWNSKTDRIFYTRPEALDYVTMNDSEGDWHIEPVAAAEQAVAAQEPVQPVGVVYVCRKDGKDIMEPQLFEGVKLPENTLLFATPPNLPTQQEVMRLADEYALSQARMERCDAYDRRYQRQARDEARAAFHAALDALPKE